jgi:hypothetical protein
MKALIAALAGTALITAPLTASARGGSHGGGGRGFGLGGFHGGGGFGERGPGSFDDSFLGLGERRNGQPA